MSFPATYPGTCPHGGEDYATGDQVVLDRAMYPVPMCESCAEEIEEERQLARQPPLCTGCWTTHNGECL
ncbi:hypothetical protein SEA_CAFASSO_117 [Gordonia phage Cafasso]|uniref:Uncharacterized protein n=1 Tax=Gordonia phage Cafasso TaxID=2851095 RepID=A0AAE7VDK0_9CAUD|nr:hypothetical protein SEA_CAFASSO_117 [Gordonia phage Cafasso]